MKMLIAVIAAQWPHVGHPEMVGERTDLAHCLLEGVLDLEAHSIETNDVDGGSRDCIGAHQEAGASCGMDHGDEAHQATCGTPQQVADPILDDHLVLAVDGLGVLEALGVIQQRAELDLPAIDPGAALLRGPRWWWAV